MEVEAKMPILGWMIRVGEEMAGMEGVEGGYIRLLVLMI